MQTIQSPMKKQRWKCMFSRIIASVLAIKMFWTKKIIFYELLKNSPEILLFFAHFRRYDVLTPKIIAYHYFI